MVRNVARRTVTAAFVSEGAALLAVISQVSESDLDLPSSCPPWTAGELLSHVVVATGRIRSALAEPADGTSRLVTTPEYYRPDERFSAAANADRIETARRLAAELGTAAAMAAELDRVSREALELLASAPADRTVRTRHGDRMLLTDFASTRVVEFGVHGLDLAASLGRPPWLTRAAAAVLEELLLPAAARPSCAPAWLRRVTLIAKLTGRIAAVGGRAGTPRQQRRAPGSHSADRGRRRARRMYGLPYRPPLLRAVQGIGTRVCRA